MLLPDAKGKVGLELRPALSWLEVPNLKASEFPGSGCEGGGEEGFILPLTFLGVGTVADSECEDRDVQTDLCVF